MVDLLSAVQPDPRRAMDENGTVTSRPYVLLSAAMSLDGCIDDTSDTRLLLSNEEDLDRVDDERARSDAILVGAGTIRADDPRLLVRSPKRRRERAARGQPENPLKVTLTRSGDVDPSSNFFTLGDVEKLVYAPSPAAGPLRDRLGAAGTVVDAGEPLDLDAVLSDLAGRGVHRLMVEGGGHVHALFLAAGVVDELQLVVAPLLVGSAGAPRLVEGGTVTVDRQRLQLAEVRPIGDSVLIRYLLTGRT